MALTLNLGEKEKDIEILKEEMRRHADQLAAVKSERDTAIEDLDVVNLVLADLSAQVGLLTPGFRIFTVEVFRFVGIT